MKKTITILGILFCAFISKGQNIGFKLSGVQTFTIIPAHTQDADSIAVLNTDWQDGQVFADIQFYKNGKAKEVMRLQIWNTYKPYSEATEQKIINRVKAKLNIP